MEEEEKRKKKDEIHRAPKKTTGRGTRSPRRRDVEGPDEEIFIEPHEGWYVVCVDHLVEVVEGPLTRYARQLAGPFDTEDDARAYAQDQFPQGTC